jgi:hypothetical protein
MKMTEAVQSAVRDAEVAYIASADDQGEPHLAVSRQVRVVDAEHVAFTGWFCPKSVANIADNPRVSLAVWDAGRDHGYQLLGEVTASDIAAIQDGWNGPAEKGGPLPQEEHEFTFRVDAILEFTSGLHSDESL